MNLRAILMLAAVMPMLSGCAGSQVRKLDDRPCVEPEYTASELRIRWIRVDPSEFDDLSAQVRSTYSLKSGGVAGMALMNPEDGRCLVIAQEPLMDGDHAMHTLGHEILHCFAGRWHKAWWGDVPRDAPLDVVRELALKAIDKTMPEIAEEARAFFAGGSSSEVH